ncbi:MAG: potassium channel family protein [Saprospiraceae bacterium]|nr:potassium channel family protein [Saprospiraceae bacterium]
MVNFIKYDPNKHSRDNNYFPVMISLGLAIFSPFFLALIPFEVPWVLPVLLTIAVITGAYASTDNFKQLSVGLMIGGVAITFEWLRLIVPDTDTLATIRIVSFFIFYAYLFFYISYHLLSDNEVDYKLLAAAITGFLVMGLMGAMVVNFLMGVDPDAFHGMEGDTRFQTYKIIYYTFITLTSVGYGDITPASVPAEALAVFFSIVGQSYFAIVIALIVGKFLMSQQKKIMKEEIEDIHEDIIEDIDELKDKL